MKELLVVLLLALALRTVSAQGTVNFFNTPTTLVSFGAVGQQLPISGPVGSYYFGLLIAPQGTTDPSKFTFTGLYATNRIFPGRLDGGVSVAVPGWIGVSKSFFVAGWSSTLGHDWNQQWLSGTFAPGGFFGLSSRGTGYPGGPSGGVPVPALDLFQPVGGTGITAGWNLAPVSAVPEPSAVAMAGMAAATLMLCRRWRNARRIKILKGITH